MFIFNLGNKIYNHLLADLDNAKERRLGAIQATVMTDVDCAGVNFDSVAGLTEAKQTLKEAVLFPLLYPHLFTGKSCVCLGCAVVRALDLRQEVAGSIPAAALSSATLDKLFTHIVQRLWCYNLMALYYSV